MRCNCCNATVESGMATCRVCGFPILIGSDNQKLITDHKIKKIGSININVKTYHYEINENSILKEESYYQRLASAMELQYGRVKWLDADFEALESKRDIELIIQITNDESSVEKSVSVHPEKIISHCKIGVILGDGFTIQLAVGSKEDYILSELVYII